MYSLEKLVFNIRSNGIKFITGNLHKFSEIREIFQEFLPEFHLERIDVPMVEIQAKTLEEVARVKLQSITEQIEPPYFIEDAGFFVDDHLHGFPGIYSHYVMETIGYEGILRILGDNAHRNAHFEAVIALMQSDHQVKIFKGKNSGAVSYEARGTSGFGFDPIFVSEDSPGHTFAELGMAQKNQISHRRRAVLALIAYLNKEQIQ